MSQTIRPFLMVQGRDAEAATRLDVSPLPGNERFDIQRCDARPKAAPPGRST